MSRYKTGEWRAVSQIVRRRRRAAPLSGPVLSEWRQWAQGNREAPGAYAALRRQQGFALLMEMVTVLAIVAILAMLAIPSYTIHRCRTQMALAVSDLAPLKANLTTAVVACGRSPASLNDVPQYSYNVPMQPCTWTTAYVDGTPYGSYVSSLSLVQVNPLQWTLTAIMGPNTLPILQGGTLTLTGTNRGGAFAWSCTFSNSAYNPYTC